ncbi:hypothetical protein MA16_Dca001011 [Dendrobium catenatum]|uniref:Uncharacterized protein n=1 Tax=Dendrobium catenatum TaxID=906689 RepID=A0A2I0WL83_9ASPA|nr:hypothetical protein MA16_Dca001011 [Dendrobium catenatum]
MDLYEVAGNIMENKEDSFTTNDVGKPSSCDEDGEFIKVGRKKGKNILPSTPRPTRAKTSSKSFNG